MTSILSTLLEVNLPDLCAWTPVFGPGQFLFHLGDPVRVMHFVRNGTVHLIRHQSDGSALVLQKAEAGSILAEASLYADKYHCDAVASTAPPRPAHACLRQSRFPKKISEKSRISPTPGLGTSRTNFREPGFRQNSVLEDGRATAGCVDRLARRLATQRGMETGGGRNCRESRSAVPGDGPEATLWAMKRLSRACRGALLTPLAGSRGRRCWPRACSPGFRIHTPQPDRPVARPS